MKRPIAINLFPGCGGMSLGLEASGFDVVVAVEFDAIHALIHHLNFPYTSTIGFYFMRQFPMVFEKLVTP
jgi:DNA (cytosine-5)-methyltransferase 1